MCVISLQDAWSDSKGRVSLDSQQDYELLDAKQKADGYFLLFKRPFSTCDPRDYLIEVFVFVLSCFVCMFLRQRRGMSVAAELVFEWY